jgi:hypothetical protein
MKGESGCSCIIDRPLSDELKTTDPVEIIQYLRKSLSKRRAKWHAMSESQVTSKTSIKPRQAEKKATQISELGVKLVDLLIASVVTSIGEREEPTCMRLCSRRLVIKHANCGPIERSKNRIEIRKLL